MKKKIGLILAGIIVVGAVFGIGNYVGANVDWRTQIVSETSVEMESFGEQVTTELVGANGENVLNGVKVALNPQVESAKSELEVLLEQYFQMKIDGLQETPEFQQIEQQIQQIKKSKLDRFTKEIDAAFAQLEAQ